MNLKTIRFIDENVGGLLCKLLGIYNKPRCDARGKIKNILVIKMWGIGSIILASPILREIRKKYPNSKIYFLTLLNNKGVYEGNNLLDEIIYFKLNNIIQITKDFFSLIYRLRKNKIDLVIDLEPFSRFSEIVSYLTNATTIGFYINLIKRGNLYDLKVPLNDKQNLIKMYLNLLKPLKINSTDYRLEKIYNSKGDESYIESLLKHYNINRNDKIICVNVSSSNFAIARRWPKENFIELTKKVVKRYKDIKIIFIGAGEDLSMINEIVLSINSANVVNLVGKTTLKQLVALFKKSKLIITNDSGPLHIAVAGGIPTISFFGPETPLLYGPLNRKKHIVFYKNLNCSPCISLFTAKQVGCRNDNAECLSKITVDEAFASVREL